MISRAVEPKSGGNPRADELRRLRLEFERQAKELSEARQQQLATAEVLKAISRSNFDLQIVLSTLVESAARLCGANLAQIFRWDGAYLRWAAGYALSPEFLETQRERTYRIGRDSAVGRTALNMRVTIIDDALTDPEYGYKEHARIGDIRTILGVPLLRSGELMGVLALVHHRVEPFTEKQIELVTIFADQAVIAIENARLFEQLETRNRELTEALEQQVATGTILHAIAWFDGTAKNSNIIDPRNMTVWGRRSVQNMFGVLNMGFVLTEQQYQEELAKRREYLERTQTWNSVIGCPACFDRPAAPPAGGGN